MNTFFGLHLFFVFLIVGCSTQTREIAYDNAVERKPSVNQFKFLNEKINFHQKY